MRVTLAIRVFFRTLFDKSTAELVEQVLSGQPPKLEQTPRPPEAGVKKPKPEPAKPEQPKPSGRSDAVTLLATLQREARFLDMIKEPLGDYSDEQVGAAARDVLRDCGKVVDRLFRLQPVLAQAEGEQVEVVAGFDPASYRLAGNVSGEPPYQGALVHHGWRTTHCKLPQWSGSEQAASIVAPAEVEVK